MSRRRQHYAVGVLVLALLLALYTSWKLAKMCMIRGWIPGAQVETLRVMEKKTVRSRRIGRSDTFWIGFGARSIDEAGPHRINVSEERWDQVQVGDPIELVRVGSDRYLRDGIFVEPGNFVFDFLLLGLELFVAILAVRRIRVVATDEAGEKTPRDPSDSEAILE